jgi:SAM-dependent methyltransferase
MPISESELTLFRSLVTRYRKKCAQTLHGLILDCGGGIGDYLPYLKGDVVSLDKEVDILRMLDHSEKVASDAEKLPFQDSVFDGVWACAVVQYVHLDVFIREAMRVTKAGGRILILVPNRGSIWDRVKKLLGMKTWWDQESIVKHYSVDELKQFGKVTGEIRFLPFESLFRPFPRLGHTLMLEVVVGD